MGIFDGPRANEIDNWICVLERSTNYEVEMAKNYLASLKIPSNILSKRDSAYSLTVSEMALVYLYVPKEYEAKARKALADLEIDFENEEDQD